MGILNILYSTLKKGKALPSVTESKFIPIDSNSAVADKLQTLLFGLKGGKWSLFSHLYITGEEVDPNALNIKESSNFSITIISDPRSLKQLKVGEKLSLYF